MPPAQEKKQTWMDSVWDKSTGAATSMMVSSAKSLMNTVFAMKTGGTPDQFLQGLIQDFCTYDGEIQLHGAEGAGMRVTAHNVRLKAGISDLMHEQYGYWLTDDSVIELLDIEVVLSGDKPTTVVLKGVKLFAHLYNYRNWEGKTKFQTADYHNLVESPDGAAGEDAAAPFDESIRCKYGRKSCPIFDCCDRYKLPNDHLQYLNPDNLAKEDPLADMPKALQGWLVRVLKSARVDVINIEAGLIGGDAEAPFSGQVLFEIPAIAAEITNGADREEEDTGWDENDMITNVMNMELIFKVQKLEPENWTKEQWAVNHRYRLRDHLTKLAKQVWNKEKWVGAEMSPAKDWLHAGEDDWEEDEVYESRLSHYENAKLEALKCTLGVLPPHSKCYKLYKEKQTVDGKTTGRKHYNARPASRDKEEDKALKHKYKKAGKAQEDRTELTKAEKEALFIEQHGTISVGYLPEARLMLYARNQWVEIDLTAEVGQVQVYGFCEFNPNEKLGNGKDRVICDKGKNKGKQYVRIVGVGDIASTFDFTDAKAREDGFSKLKERKGKKKEQFGVTEYKMQGTKNAKSLTRVNWQNFFYKQDDKGNQLEDLPPLKPGGLNRRQIDKKKIIIFPEGQLDLYIPMAEIVVVPPPCIENAMYLMTNIHFSGVDAYTARENKRKAEKERSSLVNWKDAEPGPRKPCFPRLVETDGMGNPRKSKGNVHVYQCITDEDKIHQMHWRVAKGIHLRMVCDKPALIIPSQPVKGKHLDFMQDDSITEDNQWRMHERLELMPGDFKMVMTASPEDIELSIGKLKCSLHSLSSETVSESILEKNNFDSLEKVSSTISTGGKTRHILEHAVIFSSFEEKGKVNAYAPLKVEVSTNDPEELDEKGRQKPDSMDVQVKVTEQDHRTDKAMNGTLGISLKGALVNTLQTMGEWHLSLALINKLLTKETNILQEMNKMTLKSYVDFITGKIQVPVMHSQIFFSVVIKCQDFGVNSARACIIGSKDEPIFVVVRDGTIGIRMPGIEAEVPDRSLIHHTIGSKKQYYAPAADHQRPRRASSSSLQSHSESSSEAGGCEETLLTVSIPYFVNEYILIELRPCAFVKIPSIVATATHMVTGARNFALINHISIAQSENPHQAEAGKPQIDAFLSVKLGQVQVASPVSPTETAFWFKILGDNVIMKNMNSALATIGVGSTFPFLHKVQANTTNLFIEMNLSHHTAQAVYQFYHSFKKYTLTKQVQDLLDSEPSAVEETGEAEVKEDVPLPAIELRGLDSMRLDFCNMWPSFGALNRTGVGFAVSSFTYTGCFSTVIYCIWAGFFFLVSFDHFSSVMGWIVLLHNIILCNYKGATTSECDYMVSMFYALPLTLFGLYLMPCLITIFGNGRWRRSYGMLAGLAGIAYANMSMTTLYTFSGMWEDHVYAWNIWLVLFWIVTCFCPALIHKRMWVFQATTRVPREHAVQLQMICFMVIIVIGCSQFMLTMGSKNDANCNAATDPTGAVVSDIWETKCGGWWLVASASIKMGLGLFYFLLNTCGACCQDIVVAQYTPMKEMINNQMAQPDYHILKEDKEDKKRHISRTVFWLAMLCWTADIVLWFMINIETDNWNHLPASGTYGEPDYMIYHCRACKVQNVNLVNGYVLIGWILSAGILTILTNAKEGALTATLKQRYEDAIPKRPTKKEYTGVTYDNKMGKGKMLAGLAEEFCNDDDTDDGPRPSLTESMSESMESFGGRQNLAKTQTLTNVMDNSIQRDYDESLFNAGVSTGSEYHSPHDSSIEEDYANRKEYTDSGAIQDRQRETQAFNQRGESYFEKWASQENPSFSSKTNSNMSMASFKSYGSHDEEAEVDNAFGAAGEDTGVFDTESRSRIASTSSAQSVGLGSGRGSEQMYIDMAMDEMNEVSPVSK